MINDEETIPPRTPRTFLKRALAWLADNPAFTVPAGTFVLGVVVGWVLL